MSKTIRKNKFLYTGLLIIIILVVAFFVLPKLSFSTFVINSKPNLATSTLPVLATTTPSSIASTTIKSVKHQLAPNAVKGIYMTACVAGTPSFRAKLLKLVNETELNTIVIDVKDYSGTISFNIDNPEFKNNAGGGCQARDMAAFIQTLHDNGVYVIGRITSFQDPYLAKLHPDWSVKKRSDKTVNWKDHKGIGYVDAGNKNVWQYLSDLAKESYTIGFDEINFDYIRFPSDGDMKDIYFPSSNAILVANATSTTLVTGKSIVMKSFYEYLHQTLSVGAGIPISADLFGMTATNYDDLNIGQVMEDALPNFDYIDQMVYPSHYPVGFMNYMSVAAINAHPYEIVKFSMDSAVRRMKALINPTIKLVKSTASSTASTTSITIPAKYTKVAELRPWLQDNDYPVPYTPAMVRAQIQATYDAGLKSLLLWDAGNTYTQSALLTE